MNELISLIHILSLIFLFSSIILIYKTDLIKFSETKFLFFIFFIVCIFESLSNFLEWSGITTAKESLEDISGFLIPLIFGMIFYSLIQQLLKKDLENNKNKLSSILQNAGVFMITVDKNFNITWTNNLMKDEYGDVIAKKCFSVLKNSEKPCVGCASKLTFQSGSIHSLETDIVLKNNNTKRCLISSSQIKDENGNIYETLEVIKDINDLHESKKKLANFSEQIALKNEELQKFLHITSHDLRSPLVNITGFTEELMLGFKEIQKILNTASIGMEYKVKIDKIIEDDIVSSMEYVSASIAKMNHLINSLLKLSRLSSGKITINELNISKILEDISKQIHYEAIKKNIEITIPPNLPTCIGDPILINQTFTNLISNAIKYSDFSKKSEIEISATSNDNFVTYIISDNGVGIAKEYQNKIFDVFYRIDPNKVEGEGIGLSAVKIILDRLGGRISLTSEPGKGTKFFVELPRKKGF